MPFLSRNVNIRRFWTNNFGLRGRRIFLLAYLRLEKRPHFNYAWLLQQQAFGKIIFSIQMKLVGTRQEIVNRPPLPTPLGSRTTIVFTNTDTSQIQNKFEGRVKLFIGILILVLLD